jgi:hypothetical protein
MTTIVVTPVRNEAWTLERFLSCVALWADHIVVADQGSADGSREIAARHPKVTLVENPRPEYDEGARQRLLLEAARGFPGKRLIFALDADEIPSATWLDSGVLERLAAAEPGTAVRMRWANILPGFDSCWTPAADLVFGFVDDGAEHTGERIHSARLPVAPSAPLVPTDVKVLHYQYVNWERMRSKQRWYQCWELINVPGRRPIQLYRQYHHMDAIAPGRIGPLPEQWLAPYEARGIDMRSVAASAHHRWDDEVLGWMHVYGPERFKRLAIWDADWEGMDDPRGPLTRSIHRWLTATQDRGDSRHIRLVQRALIPFGW